MKTSNIVHLSTIAGKYDVFLLDIFGVLHDGKDLIFETIDVINDLRAAGKRIFLLTNSPHRSSFIIRQLKVLGFDESNYCGILTAGDQTYHYLQTRPPPFHAKLGKTCYFIGGQSMEDILPDTDYAITKDIDSADFILAAGPDGPYKTVNQYRDILHRGAKLSIPMICSNPDLSVFRDGRNEIRAGQLAAVYQGLGGKVFFHGKPCKQTFEMVCNRLKGIRKARMLMVGDSILTDIMGANYAQIDSLLTISMTTLHEIGHQEKNIDFNRFCGLLQNLNNSLYVPTYYSNPLKW